MSWCGWPLGNPCRSCDNLQSPLIVTCCQHFRLPGLDSKLSSAFSELLSTSFKTIYSNAVQYSVSGAELFNVKVMGPGDLLVAKKTLLINGQNGSEWPLSHSLLSPSSLLGNSCYTFRPLCLGGEFLINSERCWSRSYCYTFIWHYYRQTTYSRYTYYICLCRELSSSYILGNQS